MTSIEDVFGVDHAMHIHGYSFRLIGGGKLPLGSTLQDVVLLDEQGLRKVFKHVFNFESVDGMTC